MQKRTKTYRTEFIETMSNVFYELRKRITYKSGQQNIELAINSLKELPLKPKKSVAFYLQTETTLYKVLVASYTLEILSFSVERGDQWFFEEIYIQTNHFRYDSIEDDNKNTLEELETQLLLDIQNSPIEAIDLGNKE